MGSSFVAYFDTDVQHRGLDYHYLSIPTLAIARDDEEFAILTVKGGQFILRDERKRIKTHNGIHNDECEFGPKAKFFGGDGD